MHMCYAEDAAEIVRQGRNQQLLIKGRNVFVDYSRDHCRRNPSRRHSPRNSNSNTNGGKRKVVLFELPSGGGVAMELRREVERFGTVVDLNVVGKFSTLAC